MTEMNDGKAENQQSLSVFVNGVRALFATVAVLLAFYPLQHTPLSWFYELIWERGPLQWLGLFTGFHAVLLLYSLVRKGLASSIKLAAILIYMATPFLLGVIGLALGRGEVGTVFFAMMVGRGEKSGIDIDHLVNLRNPAVGYDTLLLGCVLTMISWITWVFTVLTRSRGGQKY